jgi:hypothetical protein
MMLVRQRKRNNKITVELKTKKLADDIIKPNNGKLTEVKAMIHLESR